MAVAEAIRPPTSRLPGCAPAPPDPILVARLRSGDPLAFEALFRRYQPPLLSFCRHMLGGRDDAEDALQQTFIRAHRALLSRSPPRELRPWLYAIARNCCHSTAASRRPVANLEDHRPSLAGLSEEVAAREDLRELVLDLQGLPEDQRSALLLAELDDLSHQEIAAILECPLKKVKALIHQARTALIAQRDARAAPCQDIRMQLSVARGGELRRGPLRRHLDLCAGCRSYAAAVVGQRLSLALILPVAPSAGLAARVLGHSVLHAGGLAGAGGLGAAGGGHAAASALAAGGASASGAALTSLPVSGAALVSLPASGAAVASLPISTGATALLSGGLAAKLAIGGAVAIIASAGAAASLRHQINRRQAATVALHVRHPAGSASGHAAARGPSTSATALRTAGRPRHASSPSTRPAAGAGPRRADRTATVAGPPGAAPKANQKRRRRRALAGTGSGAATDPLRPGRIHPAGRRHPRTAPRGTGIPRPGGPGAVTGGGSRSRHAAAPRQGSAPGAAGRSRAGRSWVTRTRRVPAKARNARPGFAAGPGGLRAGPRGARPGLRGGGARATGGRYRRR